MVTERQIRGFPLSSLRSGGVGGATNIVAEAVDGGAECPVSMRACELTVSRRLVGVGYGQRLLRSGLTCSGIEMMRVGRSVGGYGHAPFRRVIDRSVDAARSSRSPSRDVRATP